MDHAVAVVGLAGVEHLAAEFARETKRLGITFMHLITWSGDMANG